MYLQIANGWCTIMTLTYYLWITVLVVVIFPGESFGTICTKEALPFYRITDEFSSVIWSEQGHFVNVSLHQCAVSCSRNLETCKAIAFNENRHCILLGDMLNLSETVWFNAITDEWKLFHLADARVFFPVFRVSAKSGQSVLDAWLNAPVRLDESAFNLSSLLNTYYKNPIVEDWSCLNISEVRLDLYKDQLSVVSLEFAINIPSFVTSWFNQANMITSPWTDIGSSTIGAFQINSATESGSRTFFIHSIYGGCTGDFGWMVAVDQKDSCSWGTFPKYPMFLYARDVVKENWLSGNIGYADDMVIYIELQL